MNGKLTLAQMRVVLVFAAILLLVLTYFLVFQKNMEEAARLESDTNTTLSKVNELEQLQPQVTDLEIFTSRYEDEMMDYTKSFPVKLTRQKSIYMLYRLQVQSGVDIQSVNVGNEYPFYYKGNLLLTTTEQSQAQLESEAEPMSELLVQESMDEMIGSMATYEINITGKTSEVYKALDWITENEERMSVGDVNLMFDSSTGKLTGTIQVNFYCMLGNGVLYKEPNVGDTEFDFGLGEDVDIFGTFSK